MAWAARALQGILKAPTLDPQFYSTIKLLNYSYNIVADCLCDRLGDIKEKIHYIGDNIKKHKTVG